MDFVAASLRSLNMRYEKLKLHETVKHFFFFFMTNANKIKREPESWLNI